MKASAEPFCSILSYSRSSLSRSTMRSLRSAWRAQALNSFQVVVSRLPVSPASFLKDLKVSRARPRRRAMIKVTLIESGVSFNLKIASMLEMKSSIWTTGVSSPEKVWALSRSLAWSRSFRLGREAAMVRSRAAEGGSSASSGISLLPASMSSRASSAGASAEARRASRSSARVSRSSWRAARRARSCSMVSSAPDISDVGRKRPAASRGRRGRGMVV
mmetsp:Transcript_33202/g.68544  ORF Transcript_33202/g.68544 Transcript_33202/m.68544 type:complete len:218 (-) Transcript_33202:457-1110(-)